MGEGLRPLALLAASARSRTRASSLTRRRSASGFVFVGSGSLPARFEQNVFEFVGPDRGRFTGEHAIGIGERLRQALRTSLRGNCQGGLGLLVRRPPRPRRRCRRA